MNNNIDAVRRFAAAVRTQLGDLPPAEVEDLTEGLEADLAERLAEDGSELGDPAAYAEELRVSAGLGPGAGEAKSEPVRRSPSEFFAAELAQFRSHRTGASIVDFALAVRPAWWILRGAVAFTLLIQLFAGEFLLLPRNPLEFLAWAALLVASVQWGRKRWQGGPVGRKIVLGTSTLMAVLAIPFMGGWAAMILDSTGNPAYAADVETAQGLVLDGSGVSNIFPYDCSGAPMTNVQLFDQEGNKIAVGTEHDDYISDWDSLADAGLYLLPSQFLSTSAGWNIFPLEAIDADPELDITEQLEDPARMGAPLPFAHVEPLLDQCKPAVQAPKPVDPTVAPASETPAPSGTSTTPNTPDESSPASSAPSSGS
ncbi:hypothetical protein ACIGB6_20295 [Paeniglutamicibacter gangotriensis]|uniref:hypothetical protein n=1 Tax=Paeniglutamicibacter gangotriensis TaxID=254787 RepID=UPI0037CA9675